MKIHICVPPGLVANIPAYMLPDSPNVTEESKSLKGYKPRQMFPGGLYKGSSAILKFNANGQLEDNNLIPGLPAMLQGAGGFTGKCVRRHPLRQGRA